MTVLHKSWWIYHIESYWKLSENGCKERNKVFEIQNISFSNGMFVIVIDVFIQHI